MADLEPAAEPVLPASNPQVEIKVNDKESDREYIHNARKHFAKQQKPRKLNPHLLHPHWKPRTASEIRRDSLCPEDMEAEDLALCRQESKLAVSLTSSSSRFPLLLSRRKKSQTQSRQLLLPDFDTRTLKLPDYVPKKNSDKDSELDSGTIPAEVVEQLENSSEQHELSSTSKSPGTSSAPECAPEDADRPSIRYRSTFEGSFEPWCESGLNLWPEIPFDHDSQSQHTRTISGSTLAYAPNGDRSGRPPWPTGKEIECPLPDHKRTGPRQEDDTNFFYIRRHRYPLRRVPIDHRYPTTFPKDATRVVLPGRRAFFHTDLKNTRTIESYRQWMSDPRRRYHALDQYYPAKVFFSPLLRGLGRGELPDPPSIWDFTQWLLRESKIELRECKIRTPMKWTNWRRRIWNVRREPRFLAYWTQRKFDELSDIQSQEGTRSLSCKPSPCRCYCLGAQKFAESASEKETDARSSTSNHSFDIPAKLNQTQSAERSFYTHQNASIEPQSRHGQAKPATSLSGSSTEAGVLSRVYGTQRTPVSRPFDRTAQQPHLSNINEDLETVEDNANGAAAEYGSVPLEPGSPELGLLESFNPLIRRRRKQNALSEQFDGSLRQLETNDEYGPAKSTLFKTWNDCSLPHGTKYGDSAASAPAQPASHVEAPSDRLIEHGNEATKTVPFSVLSQDDASGSESNNDVKCNTSLKLPGRSPISATVTAQLFLGPKVDVAPTTSTVSGSHGNGQGVNSTDGATLGELFPSDGTALPNGVAYDIDTGTLCRGSRDRLQPQSHQRRQNEIDNACGSTSPAGYEPLVSRFSSSSSPGESMSSANEALLPAKPNAPIEAASRGLGLRQIRGVLGRGLAFLKKGGQSLRQRFQWW